MADASSLKSKSGLARIWRALGYSLSGLRAAWREEAAFRQELMLAMVLVPACFLIPASASQKAILFASLMLVLVAELINSAVEATVDRISLERDDLAKRAKDTGSAAVLIALINVAVVWSLVLYDVFGQ